MLIRIHRALECFLLFFVVPVSLAVLRWEAGVRATPFLAAFLVIALVLLFRDRTFDRGELLRIEALRTGWKSVLGRFIPLAAVLAVLFFVLQPAPPFAFPREHTLHWFFFSLFFPLVPAYPEELVFRVFFLNRYRGLFGYRPLRIFASALSFSLAHLHLANPWALSLSFAGGLLFAYTFERSRSA